VNTDLALLSVAALLIGIGSLAGRYGPLAYVRPGTFLVMLLFGGSTVLMIVRYRNMVPISTFGGTLLGVIGLALLAGIVRDHFMLYSLREVKSGLLILAFSTGASIALFLVVGLSRLTLENFATVLACIFGILIALYCLYKIPNSEQSGEQRLKGPKAAAKPHHKNKQRKSQKH
jgi:Ca2+/H+ antiporter